MLRNLLFFYLLFIAIPAFSETRRCSRSTCDGGEALIYSKKEEPAIACATPGICKYVNAYLDHEYLASAGELFEENGLDSSIFLNRLMKRAGVASFQDASDQYHVAPHRQRVAIHIVDFRLNFAEVSPVDGTPSFWVNFDNLTPIKKTAESYADNGKVTRGARVVASLVNADTGIYGINYLPRDNGQLLPQSFDERISFNLEEVAPHGGQLFICSRKKYCDSIFSYFDLLNGLAGPYLYRSKDGRIVAQLNSGLSPKSAEFFADKLYEIF